MRKEPWPRNPGVIIASISFYSFVTLIFIKTDLGM
jgi:hypothetical protein